MLQLRQGPADGPPGKRGGAASVLRAAEHSLSPRAGGKCCPSGEAAPATRICLYNSVCFMKQWLDSSAERCYTAAAALPRCTLLLAPPLCVFVFLTPLLVYLLLSHELRQLCIIVDYDMYNMLTYVTYVTCT